MVVIFLGDLAGVMLPALGLGRIGLGVRDCFTFEVSPFNLLRSSLGTRGLDRDLVKSSLFTLVPAFLPGIFS